MTYCPNCGKKIFLKGEFCPSCGYRLEDVPSKKPKVEREPEEEEIEERPVRKKVPAKEEETYTEEEEAEEEEVKPAKKKVGAGFAPAAPSAVRHAPVLQAKYAGFWARLFARIIDAIVMVVVDVIVLFVIGISQRNYYYGGGMSPMGGMLTIFMLLFNLFYDPFMTGFYGGTIGKKALGMTVVDSNGNYPIGFWRALLRYIMQIIFGMLFGITYLVLIFDPQKQSLHDKIVGTYVVYA